MVLIFFLFCHQLLHLLLYPLLHLLSHQLQSILVVIITLALIFTVRIFFKLPVSCGFLGIVIFASSVQSSFLLSVAIFVYSFPGSNLSLNIFHSSQYAFYAYTCIALCGYFSLLGFNFNSQACNIQSSSEPGSGTVVHILFRQFTNFISFCLMLCVNSCNCIFSHPLGAISFRVCTFCGDIYIGH